MLCRARTSIEHLNLFKTRHQYLVRNHHYIPDENDSPEEINELSQWIYNNLSPDVPLHYSAFHPDFKMMDKERTPAETLSRARQISIDNGLNYVYTRNVHDSTGGSTYCPSCNKRIIERDWYELGEFNIINGTCAHCDATINGQFENTPGNWGRQHYTVSI